MKSVDVYLVGKMTPIHVQCQDGYSLKHTIANGAVSFFNKDSESNTPWMVIASFSLRNITHWEKVS